MSWRAWSALAVALAVLNFALTFENVWPTLWIEPGLALSVEIASVVLILALAAERFGAPSRRVLAIVSAMLVALTLGHYAEVTARALYGRPINLYYDAAHIPNVVAMFVEAAQLGLVLAALAGIALFLALLYALLRAALDRVGAALGAAGPRRALAVVAAGVIAAYPFAGAGFAWPVTGTLAGQVRLLAHARETRSLPRSLSADPLAASDLARIAGADVFLVFVESYGAATYDRPEYAGALAASRRALAAAVEASGRGVVSAMLVSPTFGGGSWLAHASLLSGVEVRDGDTYNLLLSERRGTLVQAFAQAGYRTLALMPGLREVWPEGEFYRFDELYGAARLDYRGPAFGWWRIPDQFALAKLDRDEGARPSRAPLFVFFPTITSHAPFRPTPPYQSDWGRVLSDEPFDTADTLKALSQRAEWSNLGPAYVDAVAYSFACLAGYLRRRPGDDVVLVVLGDHQPPAGVSGEGASWEVPVHVIASRPAVLDALVGAGFTPGLAPTRPALARMHELTPLLLRAFGAQPRVDVARPGLVPQVPQERADPVGL